jgi:hypothetical protein
MERAVYQQTPQALTIDEYLPQVVYEPYKARHPLPPDLAEQAAALQVAIEQVAAEQAADEAEASTAKETEE